MMSKCRMFLFLGEARDAVELLNALKETAITDYTCPWSKNMYRNTCGHHPHGWGIALVTLDKDHLYLYRSLFPIWLDHKYKHISDILLRWNKKRIFLLAHARRAPHGPWNLLSTHPFHVQCWDSSILIVAHNGKLGEQIKEELARNLGLSNYNQVCDTYILAHYLAIKEENINSFEGNIKHKLYSLSQKDNDTTLDLLMLRIDWKNIVGYAYSHFTHSFRYYQMFFIDDEFKLVVSSGLKVTLESRYEKIQETIQKLPKFKLTRGTFNGITVDSD